MTMDLELERPARAKPPVRKSRPFRARPRRAGAGALTAGELIALLEDLDPATPIVIEGQYGGFDSARAICRVPLRFNVNSLEGFGPHERASPGQPPEALAAALLVLPAPGFAE
jgi:hypothetical protein